MSKILKIEQFINESAKSNENVIKYAQKLANKMNILSKKRVVKLNTENSLQMTEVAQQLFNDLGFKKVRIKIWFDNYGMTRAVGIWNFDLNGKNVQGYRNFGGPNDNRKMFANFGDCLVDCLPYAAAIEKGYDDNERELVENEIYTASQKLSYHFEDVDQK